MEQGARNVDAPALPAGESADRAVQDGSEVQQLRELRQPLRECRAPDAVERGPALQVVPHAQRPVQYGILKHHAQTAPHGIGTGVRVGTVNPEFMRIGRSYIVNILQVQELSPAGISTFSGKNIPIPRRLYPQIQKDYMQLLFAAKEA